MFLTEGLSFKGIRPLQRLAIGNPLAGLSLPQRVPDHLRCVPPDPWGGDAQKGRDIINGIFRFAGQTIEKNDLSWGPANAKPEWLAELHGFEWLRDLRSAGGDRARRMAREMVANWLSRYQKPDAIAWRADIMGVRLATWISFHDFFCGAAADDFRHEYFSSLARQARHLQKVLPAGLSGIPLMRALKGLAYSGLCLEDGEQRLEQAFKGILFQIKEQLLADGGHISRSPQSTFEFLQILVDLRTALTAAKVELPAEVQHAIDRIAPAVKFFRHGDGALSHFNGAQEGQSGICDSTLMHSGARGKAMKSLPHCGYEKITLGRAAVIMDVGQPLMSRYADRAHAGLLSFEYSYGKDRVFVNCGTSEVSGKWREMLRSTAAHTTVAVDHRNSCTIGQDGLLQSRPDIRHKRQEDDEIAMIEASHNGYMPRHGLTHLRVVRLHDNGEMLLGEDQLNGKSGVEFHARFHLHPNIQASLINDGQEILLRARSGTGWRFHAQGGALALEESVYAGEGETPRRTQQIVIAGMTQGGPTTIAWELRREKI
ncbi:MAG TPA: heparinase II/III family protein [Patescibacteria group bacterium]|nr:heparinase II/III family protein [Patescibacteria group bacterium]